MTLFSFSSLVLSLYLVPPHTSLETAFGIRRLPDESPALVRAAFLQHTVYVLPTPVEGNVKTSPASSHIPRLTPKLKIGPRLFRGPPAAPHFAGARRRPHSSAVPPWPEGGAAVAAAPAGPPSAGIHPPQGIAPRDPPREWWRGSGAPHQPPGGGAALG